MKNLIPISFVITLMVFIGSCDRNELTSIEELDSVITSYDDSKSFGSYMTYALPDSIPYLEADKNEYLNQDDTEAVSTILTALRSNMNARGFTEVDEQVEEPDLLLNVGVLKDTYSGLYGGACGWYDDSYYWDWYPGWDWDYGYGWGYYPCWGNSYYSYTFGSLVFDLVDLANTTTEVPDNQTSLDVPWNVHIRGLLAGSDSRLYNRITTTINQAFIQSPYIRAN